MTSEPLFHGFSQLDLPRQSFVGKFSEHGRNRYIDMCALSISRRYDSTFRALRMHSCALCRKVSNYGIIAKTSLCHLHLIYYFGHYPRFKIIGKDCNKDRLKTWRLCGDGLSFCDHWAIKFTKNCVIFSNLSTSVIAPPSAIC